MIFCNVTWIIYDMNTICDMNTIYDYVCYIINDKIKHVSNIWLKKTRDPSRLMVGLLINGINHGILDMFSHGIIIVSITDKISYIWCWIMLWLRYIANIALYINLFVSDLYLTFGFTLPFICIVAQHVQVFGEKKCCQSAGDSLSTNNDRGFQWVLKGRCRWLTFAYIMYIYIYTYNMYIYIIYLYDIYIYIWSSIYI